MKINRMFIPLLTLSIIGLSNLASAQPRIGEKMPEFRLQATDQNFYGIQDGDNKISVLFFMGHT